MKSWSAQNAKKNSTQSLVLPRHCRIKQKEEIKQQAEPVAPKIHQLKLKSLLRKADKKLSDDLCFPEAANVL